MISISLQAHPARDHWLETATTTEAAGFDTLYVADHPAASAAPFVALAAAAAVTESIRLGTCVLNAGRWEPLAVASEVATLDLVSRGRSVLGLGAGHTPAEWAVVGSAMPDPKARISRLGEVARATRLLLSGDEVSLAGAHVELHGAVLRRPRPVQNPIPLMIGGNGPGVLTLAATMADIVGVTGLGKTLADGHSHEAKWQWDTLDATFNLIRSTASSVGRAPSIEVLVQHVEITDAAETRAEQLVDVIPGVSASDVLRSPFVWLGTRDEIVGQLREFEAGWGVTRYVVRQSALGPATEIMGALAQGS